MKEVSYFDILTSLINKKKYKDEDISKHYNGYVAIRWLMNHPKSLYMSNVLNSARGNKYIPLVAEYKALKGLINLPRNTFLKNDKQDKNKVLLKKILMEHFKIGESAIDSYLKLLSKEQLLKIVAIRARIGDNNIESSSLKTITEYRKLYSELKKG